MPGTTPIYGFPYPEPTDLVADYPALGQDLAEDIEAVLPTLSGLTLVTPTSIANTGGTASATGGAVTYSAVTSVSLNGVFTTTYANYLVVIRSSQSAGVAHQMRLRVSGTDAATSYYYAGPGLASSAAASNLSGSNVTSVDLYGGAEGTYVMHIINPKATTFTSGLWHFGSWNGATNYGGSATFYHNTSASYDGVTFLVGSGTLSGTARVYGLKN